MSKERSINQKYSQISVGKLTVLLSDWVVNQLSNDFGIDFDVRICSSFIEKKQKVTKTSFYVQLKSTTEACVPEPYHDLDIDDINLFANQGIPVVLIKYYEKCNQFHWIVIQPYVWDILNKEDPDWPNKSTKRIKISHKLENIKELENQVLNAQKRIARHQVSDLGIGEAINPTELEFFRNRHLEELKVISLDLASFKIKSGEFDEAKKLLEEVASSPDDDNYKLNAILNLIFQSDFSEIEEHPKILDLTRQGIELAHNIFTPNYMHLFKILRNRVQLVRIDSQLSRVLYAKKYDERDGEGTFSFIYQLDIQALDSIRKSVANSMAQSIIELIKGHYKSELIWALSTAIKSIIYQIQILGIINPEIMQAEEKNRAPFIQNFIDLLKSETDKDLLHNGYFDLFVYYYWSGNIKTAKDYLEKSRQIAIKAEYSGYKEKCDEIFLMIDKHPNPLALPNQKELDKDLLVSDGKEAIQKHLEFLGFDFKNPDTLTKETIIPALEDMDPTEYLRYCSYFRISYISSSPVGHSIGLPSLGMKAIWCKYLGGSVGFSLKTIFLGFQSTRCKECKNRLERSKDWTCKIKYFEEQNADPKFQHFVHKMVKAMERQ